MLTTTGVRNDVVDYDVAPRITFDAAAYQPMRVMPVAHNLDRHPLLQLPALVAAAPRLSKVSTVRIHDDRATFRTSFVDAPTTNPVDRDAEDVLASLESAEAWMSLLGVHKDAAYRQLLDQVLDSVRPLVEAKDPGMSYRCADIFVASPGAVTPYHMDHENNFILQIRGKKLLYVCEPLDRRVVSEASLELFHGKGSRDLVVYKDEFADLAHKFQLEPGLGGYMPSTAPHWVKNGDEVSITMSFTFYTTGALRRKALHRANYHLRRLGLNPAPVGRSPQADAAKHLIAGSTLAGRDWMQRIRGKRDVQDYSSYYGENA
jgi:hypothetical protein